MIPKQDLLTMMKKEFATTVKVLEAYPEEKEDFKPHERSSDTLKLVKTFVFEMYLLDGHLFGGSGDTSRFKNYAPKDIKEAIDDFKKETGQILKNLEGISEEELSKEIKFGGATFDGADFAMMMLHDQIHHRGQLTVYLRMAGGKVPSIYGPSADDESTNL